MNDETTETPQPRRNFISTAIYSGPRNLILSIVVLVVMYNMFISPNSRNKTQKAPQQEKHAPLAPTQETPQAEEEITRETPQPPAASTHEDAILAKLEALEEKLDKTPSAAPAAAQPPAEPTADMQKTREQIATLENKINEQQALIEALGNELAEVKSLREQMTAMEASSSQKWASITLFSQLRDTASRGDSFKPLLDQLLEINKNNAQANALLMQLLPVAASGVHTTDALKTSFATSLNQALDNNSHNTLADNMRKLIRIRKVGQQPGMDDEAVFARAELQLQQNNISGAVKALEGLSLEGKKSMGTWMRSAQENINTYNTLESLQKTFNSEHITPAAPIKPAVPPESKKPSTPEPETNTPEADKPAAPEPASTPAKAAP